MSSASAFIDYVDNPSPADEETEVRYDYNATTCIDVTVPGQDCTADVYFYENSSGSWVEYGQDWYDRDWNFRKSFTIDYNFADSDMSGFPFLIELVEDSDLVMYAQDDFDDIVFTDSENNLLPFEFDTMNCTTGNLTVWVNISSISSSVDTVFYMYYGNPSAVSVENPEGVWDSNFVGVWHMNDYDSTHTNDSTTNDYTLNKNTDETIDIIGNSQYADGSTRLYRDNFLSSEENITISFYSKIISSGAWDVFTGQGQWGVVNPFLVALDGSDQVYVYVEGEDGVSGGASGYTTDTDLHLYTISYHSSDGLKFFVDSNLEDTDSNQGILDNTGNWGLTIGCQGGATNYLNATFDEYRISNIARNTSWINLTYDTCNQTDGLLTIGKQEVDAGTMTDTYCANFSVECGSTYYWMAATQFNCSGSIWWENHTYSFTTDDCPVSHITPVNNSCCNCPCCLSLCAKLSNMSSDTVKFAFQSNYTGSWQNLEDSRVAPANTTYCLCVPEFVWYNYTYYWRVVYYDASGANVSDVYSFTTAESAEDCPCGETGEGFIYYEENWLLAVTIASTLCFLLSLILIYHFTKKRL